MDGYEATKIIRTFEQLKDLPIVALTANAIQEEKEKCFQVGMNDYLTKPLMRRELQLILQKWIGNKVQVPPPPNLQRE